MAKLIEMPKLSPTMEEGQLSAWHKKEGDEVAIDDLLADVETDKATMEFRSFDKGTLLKVLAPAGTLVKLGQPVAIFGKPGEDISALLKKAGGEASGDKASGDKKPAQGDEKASKKPAARGQGGEDSDEAPEDEPTDEEAPEDEEQPDEEQPDEGQEEQPDEPRSKKPASDAKAKDAPREAAKKPSAEGQKVAPRAADRPEKAPASGATRPAQGSKGEGKAPASSARKAAPPGNEGNAPAPASSGDGERVKASPYVRKLAREHDLDLRGVAGSGPAGRVIARDVEGMLDGSTEATEPDEAATEAESTSRREAPDKAAASKPAAGKLALAEPEVRPLSMMRKTIARRLTESKQSVPHFYLTIDVDAAALSALRDQINGELQATTAPGQPADKVSFNDLVVRACATALRRVPECNAQFNGDAILVHRRVDISVAVAVADGLVTPVLRDADRMGVLTIAKSIRTLAEKARAKKLSVEEMSQGTFSVSNLGMFGIDEFSAVINPPEGAILAVGRVRDEPVVKDGAVVAGKRLALTLSCDHRVIDGALGARFLAELRALLERPMHILIS